MYLSSVIIRGFRAGARQTLTCTFPDRFSVLLGANNAGKTTVCEAIYLAHSYRFPGLPRPSAAALGDHPRAIDVAFQFGGAGAEGPLGQSLLSRSEGPPRWTRNLERALGAIRPVGISDGQHVESTRLLYLPAHRNPVDELARREAEVLVELLRAEQDRQHGHRNLSDLRALAAHLLDGLLSHQLLQSVEARVSDYLSALTGGVSRQHAFTGRQEVDDAFLARVLELLLSAVDQRSMAQRLEVSGLGYVNLLHIAVTLAAVPGGVAVPHEASAGGQSQESTSVTPADPPPDGTVDADRISSANGQAEAVEDSFFPELFHATLIIEEPEAHLHPQLQHGLVRYLKRVTTQRPELQVIVSTHSPEMMSACRPEDIVVLRRQGDGQRVARTVVGLPLPEADRSRVLRLTALHFDASRTSTLFAERLALVEGVTDALILRRFGHAWAGSDAARLEFVDALTIVAMGSKVGEWPIQLLVTRNYEFAERVAILRDTDDRSGAVPAQPAWLTSYDAASVRCFLNHPTLEPALTHGNESLVAAALTDIGISPPSPLTADTVDAAFRQESVRGRKGEFAYAFAAAMDSVPAVTVPIHVSALFEFLYAPTATVAVTVDASPTVD